jgi:hypothetical protein
MDFDEIGFFGVPFASPLNDKTKKKNGSCNGGGKSTKQYGKTTVNSSRVVGAASAATNAATGARLSSKSSTLRRARKSKPSSLATLNGDKVRGSAAAAAAVGPFAKSVTKKRRLPLAKDADDSVCNDRMHGVTNGIDNGGGVDADDDDSSSSCSSDDEALSDLKPRSASSALTNGASEAVSASRSRPLANPKPKSIAKATLKSSSGGASGRSVRISNDSVSNKSVTKPGTKQLGLHSFLAKTSPNNTTSSFVKSGAGKSSSVASNNAAGSTARSLMATPVGSDGGGNKRQRCSFVSASSLLNEDTQRQKEQLAPMEGATDQSSRKNEEGELIDTDDEGSQSSKVNANNIRMKEGEGEMNNSGGGDRDKVLVEDELDEFSDEASDNEGSESSANVATAANFVNETTSSDTNDLDTTTTDNVDNIKATMANRKLQRLKVRNTLRFSIRPCIYSHHFPSGPPRNLQQHQVDMSSTPEEQQQTRQQYKRNEQRYHQKLQQQHSKRLLHGDSGVNILSQLFQRSILSSTPRTTASVTKFVQAGRMWNVSETVRLNPSVNHSNAPLNYNSSNAGVNIGEGGEVTAMSFDKEGVLLATGDDRGVIHVFDFDDVFAMDGRKRNEKGYMEGERIGLERDVGGVVSGNEIGVDEKEGIDLRKETEESMREEACSEQQQQQPAISTITPGSSHPLLSFQCRAKSSVGGGGVSPRVSSLHWNPDNQDHLAVSFA